MVNDSDGTICYLYISPVTIDVTDGATIDAARDFILERFGRIDVLINNAGIIRDALLAKMSEEEWDTVVATNLTGAARCSKAVLRTMMKQRSGHIVSVSSFGALSGPAAQANYAASKAGLIGLAQSLAREAGSRGVRCNVVLPGVMRTAMTKELTEERVAAFERENCLGRLNETREVARFIRFLTTTENISGQVFNLDSRISSWA